MILAVDFDQRGEPRGLYKPSHSTVRGDIFGLEGNKKQKKFFIGEGFVSGFEKLFGERKIGKGLCGFGFIKRRKVLQLWEGSSKVRVGFVSCIFCFFRGVLLEFRF